MERRALRGAPRSWFCGWDPPSGSESLLDLVTKTAAPLRWNCRNLESSFLMIPQYPPLLFGSNVNFLWTLSSRIIYALQAFSKSTVLVWHTYSSVIGCLRDLSQITIVLHIIYLDIYPDTCLDKIIKETYMSLFYNLMKQTCCLQYSFMRWNPVPDFSTSLFLKSISRIILFLLVLPEKQSPNRQGIFP